MKNKTEDIIATIVLLIIVIFIMPWLLFWIGYAAGWITKITIGKYIIEGLALFNINIPLDKIPLISGVITWFTGMFISKSNIKTNNQERN